MMPTQRTITGRIPTKPEMQFYPPVPRAKVCSPVPNFDYSAVEHRMTKNLSFVAQILAVVDPYLNAVVE